MSKFTLIKTNVNGITIFTAISAFIEEIINMYDVAWLSLNQRDSIVVVYDEYLEDLAKLGHIDQWNIICDKRNNTTKDRENYVVNLRVEYVQHNCYNTTRLNYKIMVQ